MTAFSSVLVANRGEIAVRIIRACHDAGLQAVAVYAPDDLDALHFRLADVAVRLDGHSLNQTYLNSRAILDAAQHTGAEALHPGYGFLSENAAFARAVTAQGLCWIGPPAAAIDLLGDKIKARALAKEVGAPVLPGTDGPVSEAEEILAFGSTHGYPLRIKAVNGGGGRGQRVVRSPTQVPHALAAASRESLTAFGTTACFVERFVERARHIEVQILADGSGCVQVVGTRDCTVQRRSQKLVEEAPAPGLTLQQDDLLARVAEALCVKAGYVGAGTVEFLLDEAGSLWFLEVNTRLQVEHTVTEEVTDIDLVREQMRIARGGLVSRGRVAPKRHAFQFRVNAEDPATSFAPATGTLRCFAPPAGPGIRVDSGVHEGATIGPAYDSLLAKLVVVGSDRSTALDRSRRALREFTVEGVPTVLPFHRHLVELPEFSGCDGVKLHTRWIDQDFDAAALPSVPDKTRRHAVSIGGRLLSVDVPGLAAASTDLLARIKDRARSDHTRTFVPTTGTVTAPMQGTVTRVVACEGQHVQAGQPVVIVEAMKMENPILAPFSGIIAGLSVAQGQTVPAGQAVFTVMPEHLRPGEQREISL